MTAEEGFMRAIVDNPDDDTYRLVFADWLEERGDPRGAFIRVQCQIAVTAKEDPVHKVLATQERTVFTPAVRQAFRLPFPEPLHYHFSSASNFRRGFLDKIEISADKLDLFLQHAEALFERMPIQHLAFGPQLTSYYGNTAASDTDTEKVQALLRPLWIRRLRSLEMLSPFSDINAVGSFLATCSQLSGLNRLEFLNSYQYGYGVDEATEQPLHPETQAVLRACFGSRVHWTV